MKLSFAGILIVSLCLNTAHASSGAWSPTYVDLFWNNNANWTGATFPNGIAQTAAFIDFPNTNVIDSTQNITIGSLIFDIIGRSVTIGFTNNTLIFDKSSEPHNQATIFVTSDQTHFMNTPILLQSELAVFAGLSSSIHFNQPISGNHSVSFFVDPGTHINYSSANSYTGDTIIHSGNLDLNGPSSAQHIVGNMIVLGEGALFHQSSNTYGPNATMRLEGGLASFNSTTQTIKNVTMLKQGALFGASGSTMIITDPFIALSMNDLSRIIIENIVFRNGGTFTNSVSPQAPAIIFGLATPQGYTNIDLNGNNVSLIVNNNGLIGPNKFDLEFFNTKFFNGNLTKYGAGQIAIKSNNNQLTNLSVNEGAVQIGEQNLPAFVDGPAVIALHNQTLFSGFGSLGSNGNVTLINTNGYVFPGDLFTLGNLTLFGNYQQGVNGKLLIQGQSPEAVNTLTVADGNASLAGTLYFMALQFADIKNGDTFVLVDVPNGTISGRFSDFHAYLPGGLKASLRYTENQVLMDIVSCI